MVMVEGGYGEVDMAVYTDARESELTGQEMDVGVYKWRRSQCTGTGGGLRESWMGRGGTEDQRGGRGECVLRTIPSILGQHQ